MIHEDKHWTVASEVIAMFRSLAWKIQIEGGLRDARINFHDPRRRAAVIRPPLVELTAENTDQVVVQVRGGALLSFRPGPRNPVDANLNEAERISISVNVMSSYSLSG